MASLAVAVLAAAFVVAGPPSANAQGAGLVSAILNKMDRNRRDLRSLRANIGMEKWNAQIGVADNYYGTVIYAPGKGRNSNVRIDWQRPADETLAVANGEYTLFRRRLNLAYVGSANSSKGKVSGILGFGLNVSGAQLRNSFDAQLVGNETLSGGVATYHLKLTPKNGASYKYAEIWVDDSGMPVQTKVVERNNDATTVRLLNIQRNAAISANDFHLQLPDNVKKVRG